MGRAMGVPPGNQSRDPKGDRTMTKINTKTSNTSRINAKLKALAALTVVAIGASACASHQPSNLTRANFVKMDGGRVSDVKFNAIKQRCASLGDRQFGSHVVGNMDFTLGNTGAAAVGQALGNVMNLFAAGAKQSGTFDECMAQHGFYPRG